MIVKRSNLSRPLPCPYCGENRQAQRYDPLQKLYWVMCRGCLGQGPPHPDVVESIVMWNTRIGAKQC